MSKSNFIKIGNTYYNKIAIGKVEVTTSRPGFNLEIHPVSFQTKSSYPIIHNFETLAEVQEILKKL